MTATRYDHGVKKTLQNRNRPHMAIPDDLLIGRGMADTIDADDGDNTIDGGVGDDSITSGDDSDSIDGGTGDDTIRSGDGHDRIDGGAGFDQARFGVASDEFTVTKEGDVYTIVSEEGVDTVRNVEEFIFGDTTLSAMQMDALARTTNQEPVGTDGDDFIFSGTGNDTINAGDGDDWLFGGAGHDELFGGAGADTFVFNSGHDSDGIRDFEPGIDTLRLSGALTGGMTDVEDIISTYATVSNGAVVFDFGGDDIITISTLDSLTGLSENIEIF